MPVPAYRWAVTFRVGAAALALLTAAALAGCVGTVYRSTSVELVNGPVKRVVTLVPSIAEDLFAIGAGGDVVGVSAFSDYPPAARKLPQMRGGHPARKGRIGEPEHFQLAA